MTWSSRPWRSSPRRRTSSWCTSGGPRASPPQGPRQGTRDRRPGPLPGPRALPEDRGILPPGRALPLRQRNGDPGPGDLGGPGHGGPGGGGGGGGGSGRGGGREDGLPGAAGDFRALAEKALELLKDEERRRRFSLQARAFALKRSAETIAEQIVAVYDEASEILRVEPRRLIFPFPRLPRSSLEDRPGGF